MAKQKDILFINYELLLWKRAKQWGYTGTYGIVEALSDLDYSCLMINKHWINRLPSIIRQDNFKQIWVEVVHNKITDDLGRYLMQKSGIRVALIFESLFYSDEDLKITPELADRHKIVLDRLKYFTHVIVVDEMDVKLINDKMGIPAFWWRQAINLKYISSLMDLKKQKKSIFSGTLYGNRNGFLEFNHKKSIDRNPKGSRLFEFFFNLNQVFAWFASNYFYFNPTIFFNVNMFIVKKLRNFEFRSYLKNLSKYQILINLPSLVKSYPGRVIEGMAAGCLVMTQKIVDRVMTNNIFLNEKEIVLYDTISDFQNKYLAYIDDVDKCSKIQAAAYEEISKKHTLEVRISEFMHWLNNLKC